MNRHFDQYLDIRQMMIDENPQVVVECGAYEGRCTAKLVEFMLTHPFRLFVIDDNIARVRAALSNGMPIKFIEGISYEELEAFDDESIDLCLIDTDHNYYTLSRELKVLERKMVIGGIVAMHDTVTFGHENGKQMRGYSNLPMGRYPMDAICEDDKKGLFMLDAIDEQIRSGRFGLSAKSDEADGAMAIRRLL